MSPPFSRSHVYCVTRANLKAHEQKNGVFSYKPPAYMLAVRILPRYKQSINTNIKSIIFQCRFFPSFSLWYFFVRTLSPSLSHAVPLQRSYGFLHCSFISFNHIHTQSACVLCRVRWWPVGMLHAIHPFSMYRWVFHDGLASFQWKKACLKLNDDANNITKEQLQIKRTTTKITKIAIWKSYEHEQRYWITYNIPPSIRHQRPLQRIQESGVQTKCTTTAKNISVLCGSLPSITDTLSLSSFLVPKLWTWSENMAAYRVNLSEGARNRLIACRTHFFARFVHCAPQRKRSIHVIRNTVYNIRINL